MRRSFGSGSPARRPRGLVGAARIVGVVLAALVGVAAIAVAGGWLFLRSARGGEVARRWLVGQANAQLAGTLSLDRLRFGGNRLTLTGLALRDPDDRLVARIDSVDVRFAPLALLRRRVEIRSLAIGGPALWLMQGDRGLNLTRALAARAPARPVAPPPPKRADAAGPGVSVSLRRLDVSRGAVEFRSELPDAGPGARVTGLAVSGFGSFTTGIVPAFDVDLRVAGEVREPVAGDLAITVSGKGHGGAVEGRVDLGIAGARLAAAVRTQAPDAWTVTLERLLVPSRVVAALAPRLPLRDDVTAELRGKFTRAGNAAWIAASVSAPGAGEIAVHGKVDLARLRTDAEGLVLRGRGLDLSAVLVNAPPSNLAFELEARGGGRELASLDGTVNLRVPVGRIAGRTLGPVQLSIVQASGTTTLAGLQARLPGVEVKGSGGVVAGALNLDAVVEARNLAETARSLAPRGGRPPVALRGRGRAEIAVRGTLERPSMRVAATFPRLTVNDDRVRALVVRTFTPDLRRPEASDIEVRARTAEVAGRSLRGLVVLVRAANEKVTAAVRVAGPQPLDLAVAGRWRRANASAGADDPAKKDARGGATRGATRGATIDSLTLAYPEAKWTLARPVRVSFGPGHLFVGGVVLTADEQSIALDASREGRALRGHVVLSRFDLGRLPRALLPAGLKVAGTLNVDARLKKSGAAPDLDLAADLRGGRVAGYRDLTLDLETHVRGARAEGHLAATGLGTALRATFDLPTSWPPRDRRAPLKLDLELADTDLAVVAKAVREATAAASAASPVPAPSYVRSAPGDDGRAVPALRGRVRLSLAMHGSLADPHLAVSTTARGLAVGQRPVGDVELAVSGEGDGPLQARLRFVTALVGGGAAGAVPAVSGTLRLQVARSPRELLASLAQNPPRPPSVSQLLRTPFEVVGSIDRLPLAGLARLAGYRPPVGGSLSLTVELAGTALAPRGKLSVDVAGATTGRFPPTDARLRATFDERATAAHVEVDRKQKHLVVVDARLEGAASSFRNAAALSAAPLRVRVTLNPIQLQRLGLPPETDRDAPRTLKGLVRASAAIDGSLRAPVVDVRLDAADIRLDKVLVGEARVAATYGAGQAKVDARLFSANRGSLRVEATTRADLGYPAVLRGLDVGRLPLDAPVRAQGFDLQGFSGVTAGLRSVAGLVFAEARVEGTVADPRLSGRVEWKQGGVTVTGFGEYRDIHLLLHGDQKNLVLDELRVGSGGGHARVTATANHVPVEGYRYTASANVQKFPVYSQGQALATVSVALSARGAASPLKVNSVVSIKESRVVLSDAKRREIQSLKRPADVVLVDDGEPLNRAQADKLRALMAVAERDARAGRSGAPPSTGVPRGAASSEAAPPSDTSQPPPPSPPPSPHGPEISVRVEAPRNLWVTGKDAYLELGLTPPFRITADEQPLVFGEVRILRGRIDIFGRRFDVKQPSTLRFNGSPERPEVDVQAQYKNDAENVTVRVTAKGPLDRLQLTVSAPDRPELTESQLYTLIITGRLQLAGGGATSASPSQQAVSLMGGLIASKLQKSLSNKLPLDVLTIDAGGAGLSGTQLEAGTYLTDKLYVGYIGRVGADPMRYQNRNAVHLEYQLTPRWSFDGEYGDVGTGSADLVWTKSY